MSSDAAKTHSGTFKELKRKREKLKRQIRHHIDTHKKLDASNSNEEERVKRAEQTIATLNAHCEKIDAFLNTHEPRNGHAKRPNEVKSNITDNESAKMTTSKGTLQGYNGIATVDKKHQVIIDAQAFGSSQEQHTLGIVLEQVEQRYNRLGICKTIYADGPLVTADTGFANEDNMKYLKEKGINAYIPDNRFRSRDPKFKDQKTRYGKRHQTDKNRSAKRFAAGDFKFNPVDKTCICPAAVSLYIRSEGKDKRGHDKIFFEGPLTSCRHCEVKTRCMRTPQSADHRTGHGRQVSFILSKARNKNTYTDWMKKRIDSPQGKLIYSHRMSVVEPVFGNITVNKGLNRFSLRGKDKVQGQWRLYCMVHNIEKLKNYGQLAA